MLHRLLLALCFALIFGLGQQGAATHAISHLADWQAQQHDKNHHAPACDECVVYAGLSSALYGSAFHIPAILQTYLHLQQQQESAVSCQQFPYAARAPPIPA